MSETYGPDKVGVVVIGRNEGLRLQKCLQSLRGCGQIIYVDSGSTDGSVAYAQSVGAQVEQLDISQPFTAARARNMGFSALLARYPDLAVVMFVDGDCEVRDTWFSTALPKFSMDETLAVVCGRRRERFPERTLYNFLCDVEWNTPVGEAAACGGDAIYRVKVFQEVGGFNSAFIAGEEPELCFRIRQKGYRIQRIDAEMTLHDADMSRFSQWWKRTKRSGYAFFLNAYTHGNETAERMNVREVKSILVWAGVFYFSLLLSLIFFSPIPILAYGALMVLQVVRMTGSLKNIEPQHGSGAKLKYAFMVMFGKIPQLHGISSAAIKILLKRQHTLVEYK
jgi:glycosyltransferase involved in cell wall biosynthesis